MDIHSGRIYRIINAKESVSCVDVAGEHNESIIGNTLNDDLSQRWLFEATPTGWILKSVGANKFLGYASVSDGSLVIGTDEPQKWDIWPDDEYCYRYRLYVHGTKYNWDLANYGSSTPGTPISLWPRWDGLHQLWCIEEVK